MRKRLLQRKKVVLIFPALCILIFNFSSTNLRAQTFSDDSIRIDKYLVTANSLYESYQYDSSIFYYEKASPLLEKHELWKKYIMTEIRIGLMSAKQGSYKKGLETLEEAMEKCTDHLGGESLIMANIYGHQVDIYRRLGQHHQASIRNQKRIEIYTLHLGKEAPYTIMLSLTAIWEDIKLGEFDKALAYLTNNGFDNSPKLQVIKYNILSVIYEKMGKFDLAVSYRLKSMNVLIKEIEEAPAKAVLEYNSLAIVDHLSTQKDDRVLQSLQKAVSAWKKRFGENYYIIAATYDNMGAMYARSGQYDQALYYYEKGLAVWKNLHGKYARHTSLAYHNIGQVYQNTARYMLALQYYQQALNSNDHAADSLNLTSHPTLKNYLEPNYLLSTLHSKAQTLAMMSTGTSSIHDPELLSFETYQVCDTLIRKMQRNSPYENDKLFLANKASKVYQDALTTALQLYEKSENLSDLSKAFYMSEQNKASILQGALTEKAARSYAAFPDSLVTLEQELKISKAFYTDQLGRHKDSVLQRYNRDRLFQTNQQLDQLITSFEKNYPRYYEEKYATVPAGISDIQASLPSNSAMITYSITGNTLLTFVITADQLKIHQSILPEDLDTLVREFRRSSSDLAYFKEDRKKATQAYVSSAHELYQILLASPIRDIDNRIHTLVIVPDGILNHLSFETLLITEPQNLQLADFQNLDYLLQHYEVSYGYSSTIWLKQQQGSDERLQHAFGGFAPSYTGTYQTQLDTSSNVMASLVRSGSLPLPAAKKEVMQIADRVGGNVWVGDEATEENFKKNAPGHQILHLAMHALPDDENPMGSRFLFSTGKDSIQDGLLTASELYGLSIFSELAVLSACNTGYGVINKGEGVMSLARAFMYAGCPSLVMSQWKVPDKATQQIMVSFYDNMVEGQAKSKALQGAKQAYIKQVPDALYAHPAYWGGFIAVGNQKPLKLEKEYGFVEWAIFIGIIAAGFLVLGFIKK